MADYKADFQIGLKVEMNSRQTTAIPSVGDLVPKMPESIRFIGIMNVPCLGGFCSTSPLKWSSNDDNRRCIYLRGHQRTSIQPVCWRDSDLWPQHEQKNRVCREENMTWHSPDVWVYMGPLLTYLFGAVPCILTIGHILWYILYFLFGGVVCPISYFMFLLRYHSTSKGYGSRASYRHLIS